MFLGIDLGTSGVKAILIDAQQSIIASGHGALSVQRPHPNWSEQSPEDWVNAAKQAIDTLRKNAPDAFGQLKAISFSGQMHGATLLDKNGAVIRPAILWNDTRAHLEAKQLDEHPAFRDISGNIVFPGFTAPKLMWLKTHEPEAFARVAKVLLPKDYLRFWLSGDYATDVSDASGTAWLDVANRCWSNELLEASGMTLAQMPTLVEGNHTSGVLKKEIAQQWGINHEVLIGGGGGDNAASAVGMGVLEEGHAFVSLGTSGVLFAATSAYQPNAASAVHTFCHAIENTWHQMGVILSAADAINWYAKLVDTPAAELTQALPAYITEPSDVTFLPYLSGERTPHNNAMAKGMFFGMSHNSDQKALTQAVLEGVAFALKDNQLALEAAGTKLQGVTAIGGGAQSRAWLSILANVLNVPVSIPAAGDYGAAFGAARLALLTVNDSTPQTVCAPPPVAEVIEPQSEVVARYHSAHQRYQALYQKTKDLL